MQLTEADHKLAETLAGEHPFEVDPAAQADLAVKAWKSDPQAQADHAQRRDVAEIPRFIREAL